MFFSPPFVFFQWLYFLSPRKKIGTPARLARISIARVVVVVVVKIFHCTRKYFFLLLFCSIF